MCPRSTPIPRKILPVIPCDGNSLSFRLPDNSRISRFILRKVIKDTPDCVLLLIAACHDKVKRLVLKNALKRISEDRTKYTVRLFGQINRYSNWKRSEEETENKTCAAINVSIAYTNYAYPPITVFACCHFMIDWIKLFDDKPSESFVLSEIWSVFLQN